MAKIDTEAFIQAWEDEKCLWDVTLENYKNRLEKAKS